MLLKLPVVRRTSQIFPPKRITAQSFTVIRGYFVYHAGGELVGSLKSVGRGRHPAPAYPATPDAPRRSQFMCVALEVGGDQAHAARGPLLGRV
jgi:hypothetical protein